MRRSDQNVPPEGHGKSSPFMEEVRAVAKDIYSSPANRKLAKDLIIEAIKGVPSWEALFRPQKSLFGVSPG